MKKIVQHEEVKKAVLALPLIQTYFKYINFCHCCSKNLPMWVQRFWVYLAYILRHRERILFEMESFT